MVIAAGKTLIQTAMDTDPTGALVKAYDPPSTFNSVK